jgi:hypothetical protein
LPCYWTLPSCCTVVTGTNIVNEPPRRRKNLRVLYHFMLYSLYYLHNH